MKRRETTESERLGKKYKSTTHYVLSGLVPYSEANIKFSFSPNRFFNDLEKLDQYKATKGAITVNYYRAIKCGLVEIDENGIPHLTNKGMQKLRYYEPKKLKGSASVLVIFDIPEHDRRSRSRLRTILRELLFVQIQKSVWQSEYDVVDHLIAGIRQEGLSEFVQVHESYRVV